MTDTTELQVIDVVTSCYDDGFAYSKDLEARGFNVKLTAILEGSNWFWRIEAAKARG